MSDHPLSKPENEAPLPERLQTASSPTLDATQPWGGNTPESEGGFDWRRYVAVVYRYKWLIVLCTILGTAAGVFASRFEKPQYRAQATVWIQTPDNERGPLQQNQLLGGSSWRELLLTYEVLDHSVRTLKLYLTYGSSSDSLVFANFALNDQYRPGGFRLSVSETGDSITLRTADGVVIETVAPGDSLGATLGYSWVPDPIALRSGQEIQFSVRRPRDASVGLRSRIVPRLDRNGNLLSVSLTGDNPDLTAATINTVVNRFVDVAARLKRDKLTETARTIGDRLRQAENALENAENALESYRIRTITLPREQTGPVVGGTESTREDVYSRFSNMRVELDQLDQDREAIDRALVVARDSDLSINALEVIETVQQSTEVMRALNELGEMRAELRVLRRTYTEEYPALTRLADDVREYEQTTIPELLETLSVELDSRRNVLSTRIESASGELRAIPARMIEDQGLERDRQSAENLYTTLLAAYEAARLAEESSSPDVSVLDNAVVPTRPISNSASRTMLMGILAGFGLGIAGAILLDRIDRRVRYPEQVTTELGLQLLGVIPHLKGMGNGAGSAEVAPIVEALRGIRLNLIHSCGSASPLVVTITSPGPGDGKSFVASNLALAFADAGHRTLLIDADARRGTLHRVLNVDRKPGLTDFLDGRAGRAEILRETAYPSLSIIGCGTRTPSAPELLGSTAMTQLMSGLRSVYSVIIVDSPPLGAGVDAFGLGTITGNMMVVLRLGQTDKELAEAKLDIVDRLPVRLVGAVLNDVREGAAAQYYKYYSYYMPGYEAEDEEGLQAKALVGKKES